MCFAGRGLEFTNLQLLNCLLVSFNHLIASHWYISVIMFYCTHSCQLIRRRMHAKWKFADAHLTMTKWERLKRSIYQALRPWHTFNGHFVASKSVENNFSMQLFGSVKLWCLKNNLRSLRNYWNSFLKEKSFAQSLRFLMSTDQLK